jgi:hypothetical protein
MLTGYPFWADALAPTAATIYDPILMTAVTTLTFRGQSRKQKLMGISVSGGTRTLANSVRVLVGNSLPQYRLITVPLSGFQHDLGGDAQIIDTNYFDLGGLEVLEGETITISGQGKEGAAGTGTLAGVLWIEDLEPGPIKIPTGNIICLVHGALAGAGDAGATLTNLSATLDTRDLENNRLYTPFMVMVDPEDDDVEALLFRAGKDVMTIPPAGRMVYPNAPIQFTGLEYNSGAVALFGQGAAACGVTIYMYCIESAIAGGPQPVNAPAVQSINSPSIPGAISLNSIVGGGGSVRPSLIGGGGGLFGLRK